MSYALPRFLTPYSSHLPTLLAGCDSHYVPYAPSRRPVVRSRISIRTPPILLPRLPSSFTMHSDRSPCPRVHLPIPIHIIRSLRFTCDLPIPTYLLSFLSLLIHVSGLSTPFLSLFRLCSLCFPRVFFSCRLADLYDILPHLYNQPPESISLLCLVEFPGGVPLLPQS